MLTGENSRLGQTVDNYRLLSVLGEGSTSTVYLGQRLDDPRVLVAVKILHFHNAQPTEHASFRMRFLREARAASKLRHEYVLPVLSYGDTDEITYMVMPVIVGGTLAARLAEQQRGLPLQVIATYLDQIASALDYAHEHGLVHRDVKPSNILLDEHGHVYLTDFGIARLFDTGDNALTREGSETLTRTGQVLGTPYYMAPEQIKGEPIVPATDIYALGVVLYQMVTGRVPFQGDTPLAVALQHLQETPNSPQLLREELPVPIAEVILRALAKEPGDRFPTAGALAAAFKANLPVSSPPPAEHTPVGAWPFSTGLNTRLSTSDTVAAGSSTLSQGIPSAEQVGMTVGGYYIERMISSSEIGSVYVARREASAATYRLYLLAQPRNATAEEQAAFLERFQVRAHDLTSIHHPNILPVLDFGTDHGMPYLVMSDVAGQSLGALIAQHGPLELETVAQFLDQIAAAVESAHGHRLLHLNLTPNCIFVRGDGDVVVADFGVGQLLSSPEHDMQHSPLYLNSEACSPEQLLGKPVGEYTDVYAVGAVLFQMLAGHPVFSGKTRDDIAQQHLHSTIPPLSTWRRDVPAGLDTIVMRAMAKEPELRYRHTSELATAYRIHIARTNAEKVFAVGPRNTGTLPTPQALGTPASPMAQTPQLSYAMKPIDGDRGVVARSGPGQSMAARADEAHAQMGQPRGTMDEYWPPSVGSKQVVQEAIPKTGGAHARPGPGLAGLLGNRRLVQLVSILLTIAILGGGGVFILHNSSPTTTRPALAANAVANISFFDSQFGNGSTDAATIQVTGLTPPPAHTIYDAWLINEKSERILSLGILKQDGNTFTLTYAGNGGSGQPGTNLLSFGDKVEVTLEQGLVQAPTGQVLLSAVFPPQAFVHIQHLLVAFPTTPNQQGLLVGTLKQATLLDQQAAVLQDMVSRQWPVSTRCAAQSIIDIIEGAQGPHYQPLGPQCNGGRWPSGDGFGLLGSQGYLAGVADHASLAAAAPDASPHIRQHAQHVEIATTNVTGWLQTADQDAMLVLNATPDTSKVVELVTLCDWALHGTDTNGDETIDPVPGEAGVILAYTHGQLLALLQLKPL